MKRTTRTNLGGLFSEGCRLAWRRLKELSWSTTDLRTRMTGREGEPLAVGVVDRVLYGDAVPSLGTALQLQRLLGVPPEAWEKGPTRRFVLPAAKRAAAAAQASRRA